MIDNNEHTAKGILNKNFSILVKYIAAIIIVICHIFPSLENNKTISVIFNGTICTGIFFFYSGLGFRIRYDEDKNYLDKYILKKIKKIWIPYCIANTIYYLIRIMLKIEIFNIYKFFLVLFGIVLSNKILWFIVELFIIDVILYIVYKLTRSEKKQTIYIFTCYMIFMIISILLDIPNWWYITTSTVILGLYYDKIKKFLNKNIIYLFNIMLYILYIICFYNEKLQYRNYIITLVYLVLSPLFICALYFLFENKKIKNLSYIKKIKYDSLYIYMYHCCVKLLVEKIIKTNSIIIFIVELVTSLILAHTISKIKKIKKKDNENEKGWNYNHN